MSHGGPASAFTPAAGTAAKNGETDGRIFVIAGDNTWVHIYPDASTLLNCKDTVAAGPGPLDFFDVRGQRLGPVFGTDWTLESLEPTADEADPDAVQRRLCAVVESVRASLEQRLALDPNPPGDLEVALARLPELGEHDLPECFALLAPNFGDGEDSGDGMRRDDGSVWHNFWCH